MFSSFVKAGHVTAVVVLIVLRCHGLMPRKKYRYVRDYTIFGTKIIENGSFRGFPVGRTRTYVPVAMLPLLVLGAGCCFCCSRSNGYAERAVAACLGSVWKLKGSLNISIPWSSRPATSICWIPHAGNHHQHFRLTRTINININPFRTAVPFWGQPVKFQVVCPQNGTAVLKYNTMYRNLGTWGVLTCGYTRAQIPIPLWTAHNTWRENQVVV